MVCSQKMHYLVKEYEIFKCMIHIVNYFPEKLNQFTLQNTKDKSTHLPMAEFLKVFRLPPVFPISNYLVLPRQLSETQVIGTQKNKTKKQTVIFYYQRVKFIPVSVAFESSTYLLQLPFFFFSTHPTAHPLAYASSSTPSYSQNHLERFSLVHNSIPH